MITTTILTFVIILSAILGYKYNKWGFLLFSAVGAAVIVFIGTEQFNSFLTISINFFHRNSRIIYITLFLFAFVGAAAMYQHRRDAKLCEQDERERKQKYIKGLDVSGFVEEGEKNLKTGWENYIRILCDRLSKTKLDRESFALGIAGDWGSGKTTFLNEMRPELEKSFKVVDFNPWVCTDEKVVIADFFKTLKAKIPQNSKALLNDIRRYVTLLTETKIISNNLSVLTNALIGDTDSSITELKAEIEDKLSESNIRYAVLIDDLDRLHHNELFEILRLIRITASFSNILFVVTYDKHHVEEMLKEDGISDGSQYVKKIFNTEIILPGMEPYTLPKLLMDEIERLLGPDSPIPATISDAVYSYNNFDTYELLSYLKNFRDIKRFAMAFATDVATIENVAHGEFSFIDFFWLEILRYIDYEVYSNLRLSPSTYVKISNLRLELKDDLKLKEETKAVLQKLFPKRNKNIKESVSYLHNFNNYFSFRIQDNKLSHTEFKQLLLINTSDILTSKIEEIYTQGKLKSLLELFKCETIQELKTIDEKKNYISLMFSMMSYLNKNYINTIEEKLNIYNFTEFDKDSLSEHARVLIHQIVQENKISRGYINVLLSQLHSKCHYDPCDEQSVCYVYRSIIDDEFLVKESEDNLRFIFALKKDPVNILSVTTSNNGLRLFLENATVNYSTDISYNPPTDYYKCLPFGALLEYFVAHKSDKLNEFMQPFEFDENEWGLADDSEYFEQRRNQIEKVFGSLENFKKFTNSCFTNSDEEKEHWIKTYWKIK